MLRWSILALVPLAVACSSSDAPDAGSPEPDAGPTSFDATVVDSGPPPWDGGVVVEPDAGFGSPATLYDDHANIQGVRTYVRIEGTTTSTMPPLIVMNTGPMLGHEYLLEPLEFLLGPGGPEDPDRLVVFYDMRATGQSGFGSIESSTVTIDAHVEDLGYLLDWVDDFAGRTGPVDFLAHGYGTAVATLYSADHPARVSRMVFVAPYPSEVNEQAQWGAEWNSRLNSADRMLLAEITMWNYCFRDFNRCSRDVWNIIGPTWFCDDNRDLFVDMTFEHVDIRPFTYFTVIDLRDRQFDFRPVMETISIPTTIISGPCDPIPATAPANYATHLQNAEHFVIPDTGHFPMTEAPAAFQQLVKRALTY